MVIAIDGPAGAGKSTVARALAERLGVTYLDSGAMYRCVALSAMRAGADLDDGVGLARLARGLEIALADGGVLLNGEDVTEAIRAPEVSAAASRVSVHPEVREAMVERQRALIAAGDYVAEGRDIGTVVSPDAPLKVFLTASDAERARRRAAETGEPLERGPGGAGLPGRPRPPARARRASRRRRRDRDRHHGARRRRGRGPDRRAGARAGPGGDERPASPDRRRRLSERRQVDARQPAGRRPRGRRPPRGRRDPRPQGARLRVERAPLSAGRHRWRRPGRRGLAGAGGPAPGPGGDRRLPTWWCWSSTPARGCARATPRSPTSCAAATSRGRGRQQDRRARRRLPRRRVPPPRAR